MTSKQRRIAIFLAWAGLLGWAGAWAAGHQGYQPNPRGELIAKLEALAEFGAFDWIVATVDREMAHLSGLIREPALKNKAESAVKRMEGIERVNNEIKILPVSFVDDRIRIVVYSRIYGHPSLKKYLPKGRDETFIPPTPGARNATELVETARFHRGRHGIHIIVERGHVTLLGAVDNKSHRRIAEVQARSVDGVFSVSNSLEVVDR